MAPLLTFKLHSKTLVCTLLSLPNNHSETHTRGWLIQTCESIQITHTGSRSQVDVIRLIVSDHYLYLISQPLRYLPPPYRTPDGRCTISATLRYKFLPKPPEVWTPFKLIRMALWLLPPRQNECLFSQLIQNKARLTQALLIPHHER